MSILFDPIQVKSLRIRNRTARSATYEGMGTPAGEPSDELAKLYAGLADGEIGLIFTSATLIERFRIPLPEGAGLPYPTFIANDDVINRWKPIVADAHTRGARIAMQVVHPGRQENPMLRGEPPIAPSSVEEKTFGAMPREMTRDDIDDIIEKFAQACRRVKEAGFDAVQLHGGHGYLLSNFISPYTNRRADEYGRGAAGRSKIIVDIVRRARELIGTDYPIMIKMNCEDFVPGGLERKEAARVAAHIAEGGIDCIEITGGIYESREAISKKGLKTEAEEAYFRPHAEALRRAVDIPLILVGGMKTLSVAEKALSDGVADMVSFCRPLIREPRLIKRWKEGDLRKAACVSCSKCADNVFSQPLRCYVEEAQKKRRDG
jgi:2,4-dienoyl-CoA reductase-like NADH-dependent reductase (Old Yellow Enzyme family)